MSTATIASPAIEDQRAILRDGTRIAFRLATPADRDALLRGFEKLSLRSRYFRFFQAAKTLPPRLLDILTAVDSTDRVAVIAYLESAPEDLVGVVRFTRLDDSTTADVALTVIDEWHGKGVATATYDVAERYAAEQGIQKFSASVLSENTAMRQFFVKRGATVSRDQYDRTVLDFTLDLATR